MVECSGPPQPRSWDCSDNAAGAHSPLCTWAFIGCPHQVGRRATLIPLYRWAVPGELWLHGNHGGPSLRDFSKSAIVLPQKADAIGKQRTSPQFLNRTAKAQRVCLSPKPQEAGLLGSHPPHMPSARYHLLQSQEFLGQLTSISKHPVLIQHRLGFGEVSLWHAFAYESPGECVNMQILGGLRFCFSNKQPGNADASGMWSTLWAEGQWR